MKIPVFLTLAATCLTLLGCANNDVNHDHPRTLKVPKTFAGTYPIRAIGTTGMVADLVRNVGGTHVHADQLFAPDIDPHLYKATDADTAKLAGADVIFYSGLHLEGKMTEIFDSLGRKLPCFGVADHLDRKLVHKDEEGAVDPHVWFDVSLWSKAADVVRDALALYDPSHAGDYQANCTRYQQELVEVHAYAQRRMLEVPEKQRVLITSHDAFRYFGRAYKIEVKGIQGISTDSEASVGHITRGLRRQGTQGPAGRHLVLGCDGRERHARRHLPRHDPP